MVERTLPIRLLANSVRWCNLPTSVPTYETLYSGKWIHPAVYLAGNRIGKVQTNSRKGVINKKCYASGVPNDTGRAVHWNSGNTGLPCAVLEGLTDDWKLVIDDEGNAQLTCKIHSNSWMQFVTLAGGITESLFSKYILLGRFNIKWCGRRNEACSYFMTFRFGHQSLTPFFFSLKP